MEEAEPGQVEEDLVGLVGQEDLEVDVEESVQLKREGKMSIINILLPMFFQTHTNICSKYAVS